MLVVAGGCEIAHDAVEDVPRVVNHLNAQLGDRPMIRRALMVSACLALPGCAVFPEQPGTPLARAAHAGDIAAIRELVANGADPNEYDATHQTPLHWAARGGHPIGPHQCRGEDPARAAVVSALIEAGADVNAVDRRVAIPGGSSGWTSLHIALHHEQFSTAARLLERGADARVRTRQGTTALAMAADEGAPKTLLEAMVARVQ